ANDIDVFIASDPLTMVGGVALAGQPPATVGVDHHAHLSVPAGAQAASVLVLDELGNHLLELPLPEATASTAPPPPVESPGAPAGVPIYRRWYVWGAASAACLVTGYVFGRLADSANEDLLRKLASAPYYDDLQALRETRDRDALVANTLVATGAGLAVVTFVVYKLRPRETATLVTPTASRGAAGLVVSGRW
ncbi:MAG TPA: hypothetical protein VL326_22700, partial [Kofleriaceae bacterium]|nr:hypothetical protein [Kofleriaceae bacterium]